MNKQEIMKILPHRDAMLLVEELTSVDNVAHGKYTVRGDEWFLQGHFPGNPVVPGVVLCEMMAQCAAILLAEEGADEEQKGFIPFLTGLNNVKFRKNVLPGDTLETECSIIKSKKPFYFAKGKGYVDGKLCVNAEFSFAVMKV